MKVKSSARLHSESMDVAAYMLELGKAARGAARELARAGTDAKNRALQAMATEIRAQASVLLEANRADVEGAKKADRDGAFIDRLTLTRSSIEQMAAGLEHVAKLDDPIGRITELATRPTGIEVG